MLPFDIFDHIFGHLRSDPKSLIACSKAHPALTQITDRHRYYHTIVHTGSTAFPYSFEPIRLIKLISATPRIVNHVRVLQIEFDGSSLNLMSRFLVDIAWLLPRFLLIECLILSTRLSFYLTWQKLPPSLRTAVEDYLRVGLPTLQEVHVGQLDFPLSILDKNTNINRFSVSITSQIPGYPGKYPDTIYPQLKSLSVRGINYDSYRPFSTWASQRIGNLRSLELDCTDHVETGLDLLKGCSDTLEYLHIHFWSMGNT